jgi:thiol:disulfide interchange protein DsbC
MTRFRRALRLLVPIALGGACLAASADEAAIRKALAERYPHFKSIDEVSRAPMPGLYEVRTGADLYYTDERGDYIMLVSRDGVEGHVLDTRAKLDLTEERLDRMLAAEIPRLPFKDAIVRRIGTGSRRMVVFEDPNCHYCRDVEKSFVSLKDVTIYTFVIPILGPDSVAKARDIWCSKDNAGVWRDWMLDGIPATRSMGPCDVTALDRNRALADRFRVNGTPAILFDDGSRFAGAADLAHLSKRLDEVAAGVKHAADPHG